MVAVPGSEWHGFSLFLGELEIEFIFKNMKIFLLLPLLSLFICLSCHAQGGPIDKRSLNIDGLSREYFVYSPAKNAGKLRPMVIFLHGGGGIASKMPAYTGGNELAEKEGFIAVYPQGLQRSWNIGNTPTYRKNPSNADDVAFISKMIDMMIDQDKVDARNIFVTGPSRGGMMTFYLAGKIPDKINSIAPMIATLHRDLMDTFAFPKPIPTLMINGTADPLILYEGGVGGLNGRKNPKMGRGFVGAEEMFAAVGSWNGCSEDGRTEDMPNKDPNDGCHSTISSYQNCPNAATQLIRVENGGHAIPGKKQYAPEKWIGKASQDFDGIEFAWNFFKQHLKD